jgi:hypothetical protein
MTLKKQYLIPTAVIVVLLLYLIFGSGRNKMSYDVPELSAVDQDAITKIEVSRPEKESFTLSGGGESWKILPQEYPADPVKVEDMLKVISELTLTELASEREDYQRYDLDEDSRIRVKAYIGDTMVREFDIGKTPSTYRHTFVRLADDGRVYYARESFRSRFDLEVKDLRDKAVMSFDKNEISEIRIVSADSELTFTKTMVPVEAPPVSEDQAEEKPEAAPEPQEQEAWISTDGKTGAKGEIDAILNDLSDLRCDEFIEDREKEDFIEPEFTVTLKGTKDYTLRIFAKEDEDGGKYPAVSSENSYPFLLSTYRAERIMKKPADLFPEEKDES